MIVDAVRLSGGSPGPGCILLGLNALFALLSTHHHYPGFPAAAAVARALMLALKGRPYDIPL